MSFHLQHGHPDNHPSLGVSKILVFLNIRLNTSDIIYNLTKCPNKSRVQFNNKNFDRMFNGKNEKQQWVPLWLVFKVVIASCELPVRP